LTRTPSRTKYVREFLGDPRNVILFTLCIGILVAILRNIFLWQIVGLVLATVIFFLLGYRFATKRVEEELLSTLPGQVRFHRIIKELKLNENGKGDLKIEYHGEYFGKTPLYEIPCSLEYNRSEALPAEIDGTIDNIPTKLTVNSYAKCKNSETIGYESCILFRFPECVKKGMIPLHSYVAKEVDYSQAFKENGDYTTFRGGYVVDCYSFKVHAPQENFYFSKVEAKALDRHGRDDIIENERIQTTMPPEFKKGRTLLEWKVTNPKLSLSYCLKFWIKTVS